MKLHDEHPLKLQYLPFWLILVGLMLLGYATRGPATDTTYTVDAALQMRNSHRTTGLYAHCTITNARSEAEARTLAQRVVDAQEPDFTVDVFHVVVTKVYYHEPTLNTCEVLEDR
jgi:hypothetical protein